MWNFAITRKEKNNFLILSTGMCRNRLTGLCYTTLFLHYSRILYAVQQKDKSSISKMLLRKLEKICAWALVFLEKADVNSSGNQILLSFYCLEMGWKKA